MNISVLLAGNDERYIKRLAEIIKRKTLKTGDTLKITLFTGGERLKAFLAENKPDAIRNKFHIALIDGDINTASLNLSNIPVVFSLTDEGDKDGGVYLSGGANSVAVYKYQRISGIIDKMLLEFAKKRGIEKKGNAAICVFFSATGGSGTSTIAAAYAIAAARAGIKPLYVSFEHFNSTEIFFSENTSGNEGLYEIFCSIAESGGIIATIDAVKKKDRSGVEFLKKFTMWTEVAQIKPPDIETFIDAARASYGVGIVVIDLGCVYTQFTEAAMECADEIFIVADTHSASQLKTASLFCDKTFFKANCIEKTKIIYNNAYSQGNVEDFGAKSVIYVHKVSSNSVSGLLESAVKDLRGLADCLNHGAMI